LLPEPVPTSYGETNPLMGLQDVVGDMAHTWE
jgi:hypothetical protein